MPRRIAARGLVELRKMLANFFKAIAVSFLSCDTGGMLFLRALFNLRVMSRISSLFFLGMLILCGKICSCLGYVDSVASVMMRCRA